MLLLRELSILFVHVFLQQVEGHPIRVVGSSLLNAKAQDRDGSNHSRLLLVFRANLQNVPDSTGDNESDDQPDGFWLYRFSCYSRSLNDLRLPFVRYC